MTNLQVFTVNKSARKFCLLFLLFWLVACNQPAKRQRIVMPEFGFGLWMYQFYDYTISPLNLGKTYQGMMNLPDVVQKDSGEKVSRWDVKFISNPKGISAKWSFPRKFPDHTEYDFALVIPHTAAGQYKISLEGIAYSETGQELGRKNYSDFIAVAWEK